MRDIGIAKTPLRVECNIAGSSSERETLVGKSMNVLHTETSGIYDVSVELEKRLSSILLPKEDPAPCDEKGPPRQCVPLSESIDSNVRRVADAKRILMSILDRIEI
jgi:hypothetical protein